ncbi:hypothetical protein Adt_18592 [Abeliophyllum distichum]|uniref:Uncharacterized protein n=1 Tax=Abeliophyllum distichum TaxID=126358 RepID=A0ABD1TJT4_9LAMI
MIENVVVDVLSRRGEGEYNDLIVLVPAWFQEVIDNYVDDCTAKEKIQTLIIDLTTDPLYQYCNGLLKYKSKLLHWKWRQHEVENNTKHSCFLRRRSFRDSS